MSEVWSADQEARMTTSLSAGRLAPHGGSLRIADEGKQRGAAGAPVVRSGPVPGFAGRAHCLDRQTHEVTVPLQPDVQSGTVADAEELAAFKAAPFGRVQIGSPGKGCRPITAVVERIGHWRLQLLREHSK